MTTIKIKTVVKKATKKIKEKVEKSRTKKREISFKKRYF